MEIENLEIIQRDHRDWFDILKEKAPWLNPISVRPIKTICKIADQSCQTIIVEKNYVDMDYSDIYSNYYATLFADYPSKCWRLHFFSDRVDVNDLLNLSEKQMHYQGFCVLRPTPSFQVSRTIMRSPRDDGQTQFTLCASRFDVNLFGNRLSVTGAPFIQQDTNVNVCAQSAMWMVALYMHKRFGTRRYLPSEINQLATKYETVGSVREGLSYTQMLIALREMGFEPHWFPKYDDRLIASVIYGYVESCVPVILLLDVGGQGHAVTAVGHDFSIRESLGKRWDSNVYWIDNFYVNDDASGPYMKIPLKPSNWSDILRRFYGRRNGDIDDIAPYNVPENVRGVIVPTPKEVKIRLDDVMDSTTKLMSNPTILNAFIKSVISKKPSSLSSLRTAFFKDEDFRDLVYRHHLMESNSFKTDYCANYDLLLRTAYRSMQLPKYVWVTEISEKTLLNRQDPDERKRIGEIVMDPTADRHSHLSSYLSIHFKGRLLARRGHSFSVSFDPNELPCPHYRRTPSNQS